MGMDFYIAKKQGENIDEALDDFVSQIDTINVRIKNAIYEYKPILPKMISEYDDYDQMEFIADNDNWTNTVVTAENGTVYVPVVKIVDEADILLEAPVCGEQTATAKFPLEDRPNLYYQDSRPDFTVADDDAFTIPRISSGREKYWTIDPDSEDVTVKDSPEGLTPDPDYWTEAYILKFNGGHTYQANTYLEFKIGYLPDKNMVVKVNGEPAGAVISLDKEGRATGDVTVNADVTVRHAGNASTEWTVTTDSTCTEPGVRTGKCSSCEESTTEPIDPLGHDFGEWEVTTEATCTEEGVETKSCSRCDATETRPTDSTGHDYQAVVTEPTCMSNGYTTHTCKKCDDSYVDSYTYPVGHDWDDGTVTEEPNCTEAGTKTVTCRNDPTHTMTQTIAPLRHDYEEEVTEPTCTERGYTTYTCTRCNDSYEFDYVDALGHDWGDWEEKTDETGTYNERSCKRSGCDVTEKIYLEGTCEHTDCKTIEKQEPTCTEPGYESYEQCENCKVYLVNKTVVTPDNLEELMTQLEIEPLGHEEETVPAVEPTCTTNGLSEGIKCSRCDELIMTQVPTPATGHEEVTVPAVEPTCTEDGHSEGTQCSICGEVLTTPEVFPATGHDYKTTTTKATLTKSGKIETKCTKCDDVQSSKTISYPKTMKLSAKSYVYSGKAKKPTVTVIGANGMKIGSTNYSVKYGSGRKKVGKYKVTITFKGNYTGTKTLTFKVNPKKAVIRKAAPGKKRIKVTMRTKVSSTGGSTYQIKYRVKGTSKWKTVTAKSKTKTIKNLKKGKRYQIKVRSYKKVKGATCYGKWSKTKTTKKVK